MKSGHEKFHRIVSAFVSVKSVSNIFESSNVVEFTVHNVFEKQIRGRSLTIK